MADELTRGTRLGRYDLLLRIGRGGMATVWIARERAELAEDQRIVAIKAILSDLADEEEFLKMFLDEGRLVQRIRHPNVVELYEVGQDQGIMFMAMEWVEGDSLHTLIAEAGKRRPIPPEMAVRIIADVAGGLHAAHELKNDRGEYLGVVHRDVSPHNILIGTNGSVKLVDFGVAKAKERMAEATVVGQVKGKFGYMSPEQAIARPVDRRSDVFSLGIVLFELTTGRRLFRGDTDAETLALVVQGEIPRPSTIDPAYPPMLEALVTKALSRSRRERFQTAREFQKALERYLKEERIVVPRNGLAGLLKRVLGDSIEQRRRAIRASLKALDGDAHPPLISGDSPFTPSNAEMAPPVSESSEPSAITDPEPVESLLRPDDLTGSFAGGPPSSASRPQAPPPNGQAGTQSSLAGYVIGAAGLLVAAAALLIYYLQQPTHGFSPTTDDTATDYGSEVVGLDTGPATATAGAPSTRLHESRHRGGPPTIGIEQLSEAHDASAQRQGKGTPRR